VSPFPKGKHARKGGSARVRLLIILPRSQESSQKYDSTHFKLASVLRGALALDPSLSR